MNDSTALIIGVIIGFIVTLWFIGQVGRKQ